MNEAHEHLSQGLDQPLGRQLDTLRPPPSMGTLNPGPRLPGLPKERPPRGSQNPGGELQGGEHEVPDLGTLNPGPRLDGVLEERPPRGSQNPGGVGNEVRR